MVQNGDPHQAHGMGTKNVFRNGDPSRPFKFQGEWYIVLGAGKNETGKAPLQTGATPTPGCRECNHTTYHALCLFCLSTYIYIAVPTLLSLVCVSQHNTSWLPV